MASSAGRSALITGGTSGIGLATASLLHEKGFRFLVAGLYPDTLAAVQQTPPGEIVIVKADSRSASDSVGQVLGRKPRSYAQWLERNLPDTLSHAA